MSHEVESIFLQCHPKAGKDDQGVKIKLLKKPKKSFAMASYNFGQASADLLFLGRQLMGF